MDLEVWMCAAERKDVTKCEELVLNAVATINNLSFYCIDGSALLTHRLHIANCIYIYLFILYMFLN